MSRVKILDITRKTVSWLFVIWGIACGVLALSLAGYSPHSTGFHVRAFEVVLSSFSFAGFAFVPLFASTTALHNRSRAAWSFLVAAPFVFLSASLIEFLEPACAYNGPVEAFYCFREIVPGILAITAPVFLLPGLFWWLTSKLKWEPLLSSRPIPFKTKLIRSLVTAITIFGLVFAGSTFFEWRSTPFGECNYFGPPLVRQRSPQQVVFTGSSLRSIGKFQGTALPRWQIIAVDRRFWGLRPWERRFVLVRGGLIRDSQPYLIDGLRPTGLLTRFLPLFEIYCTHTKPLKSAQIDMRLLHDGPPKNSGRIIGIVVDRVYSTPSSPIPAAKVQIVGPGGKQVVLSDAAGIYDAPSVPPGHYKMTLEAADPTNNSYFTCERDVQVGEVGECFLAQKSGHL